MNSISARDLNDFLANKDGYKTVVRYICLYIDVNIG